MDALTTAKAMYAQHGLDLEADLAAYLRHGYVVAGPDRLLLFKAIDQSEADWHPKTERAWYVHLAVGDGCLGWFRRQAPYELPFLAWFRRKDGKQTLRFYPTDRITPLLTA